MQSQSYPSSTEITMLMMSDVLTADVGGGGGGGPSTMRYALTAADACFGNVPRVDVRTVAASTIALMFFMEFSFPDFGASSRSRPVMKGVCSTLAPDSMRRR
jgi:hypothetical protein